jgi:hypothetical protein
LSECSERGGGHHALDVYRIVEMLTQDEVETVRRRVEKLGDLRPVIRAREIVQGDFSSPPAMGLIRLREHSLFTQGMDFGGFVGALAELFR